jgi:hypothetical protein
MQSDDFITRTLKEKLGENGKLTDIIAPSSEKVGESVEGNVEDNVEAKVEESTTSSTTSSTTETTTSTTEPTTQAETPSTEGEAVVKKSVFDILKDEEAAPVETKAEQPVVSQEELEAKIREKLLAEIDAEAEKNPFYKLIKMGAKPEDIQELAKELVPEDYSSKRIEDLIAMDYEKLGLEGEDLKEAVADKLDELESMKPYQKKQFEAELRSKFKPTAKESALLKQYEQMYQEQLSNAPKQFTPQDIDNLKSEDIKEISTFVTQLEGLEIEDGVSISKDDLELLVKSYDFDEASMPKYITKENKLNVKKYISDKLLTNPKIVEKRIQAAYEKGKREALQGFTVTGKSPIPVDVSQINSPKGQELVKLMAEHVIKGGK